MLGELLDLAGGEIALFARADEVDGAGVAVEDRGGQRDGDGVGQAHRLEPFAEIGAGFNSLFVQASPARWGLRLRMVCQVRRSSAWRELV